MLSGLVVPSPKTSSASWHDAAQMTIIFTGILIANNGMIWHWLSKMRRAPQSLSPLCPISILFKNDDRQFWAKLTGFPTCNKLLNVCQYISRTRGETLLGLLQSCIGSQKCNKTLFNISCVDMTMVFTMLSFNPCASKTCNK